jgi:hypothetical protein
MTDIRKSYKTFIGNDKGKRPLRKPKRRREDKIKIDVRENLLRSCLESSG